ncbi:cysteine hydrolase, partial [Mycobacteriaceae bacterium Msp059]|nr:cysteine hydrolase [Mycobacteriaceae bacterium Msp059]
MTALAVDGSPRITPLEPVALDPEALGYPPDNLAAIPPLAKQWEQLDFREILSRPAAFLSI